MFSGASENLRKEKGGERGSSGFTAITAAIAGSAEENAVLSLFKIEGSKRAKSSDLNPKAAGRASGARSARNRDPARTIDRSRCSLDTTTAAAASDA